MLLRYDVIDVKRQRVSGSREPAVFTATFGRAPDLLDLEQPSLWIAVQRADSRRADSFRIQSALPVAACAHGRFPRTLWTADTRRLAETAHRSVPASVAPKWRLRDWD